MQRRGGRRGCCCKETKTQTQAQAKTQRHTDRLSSTFISWPFPPFDTMHATGGCWAWQLLFRGSNKTQMHRQRHRYKDRETQTHRHKQSPLCGKEHANFFIDAVGFKRGEIWPSKDVQTWYNAQTLRQTQTTPCMQHKRVGDRGNFFFSRNPFLSLAWSKYHPRVFFRILTTLWTVAPWGFPTSSPYNGKQRLLICVFAQNW